MYKTLAFLFIAISLPACNSRQADEQVADYLQNFNLSWAQSPIWDDGQAEVVQYQAERIVYGKKRTFEYTYIAVKEVFNEEFTVKTDDYQRNDLYPVMKVNKFCSFETKAYPYHYLTSIFFKQENAASVHKLSNTSQEWCGNTAKSFIEKDDHYLFEYMSYWDNQGNGSLKIDNSPLFEDQLSYTLRALKFKEGLNFEAAIYPTQVSSKAAKPIALNAKFTVSKAKSENLSDIDSSFIKSPWLVQVVKSDGLELNYWINGTHPNTLLKMTASDGRKLSISKNDRDAYWSHE